MDLWQRARLFAEEAAKELTTTAATRTQQLTTTAAKFSQEFVTETAKKSKELAAEASKRADQIRVEAIKRADQIKTINLRDIPIIPPSLESEDVDLGRFGITEELREFVKGITINTFRDFPMEDGPEMSDVPTVSNVRQDLNEWQARHATIVLSTVKEISKLRYELCPRYMKERKFWRIYFMIVNNYVSPYEKQYMENLELESVEQKKDDGNKESSTSAPTAAAEVKGTTLQSKTSTSSNAEHDLDVFLLGDLGSSDEGPDDGDDAFDDDLDKVGNTSGLESDLEDDQRKSKQSSKTSD